VDGFERSGAADVEDNLLQLGQILREAGYRFVTITPESHRRVNARPSGPARSLRDVFGWNRPFEAATVGPAILSLLEAAGALTERDRIYRSKIRFSTFQDLIFVHSAYPTIAADSVFFGPDTYRFLAALERCIAGGASRARRIVDIGTGSGAAGIFLARSLPDAKVILADISEQALRHGRVNAALNGAANAVTRRSDVLAAIPGQFDLIVANPPYLVDPKGRLYRDGGGTLGYDLSLRILEESLDRLAPGGMLLLYTGSAIVDGIDQFGALAQAAVRRHGLEAAYAELDPDVFGEELEGGAYGAAERIAAVTLTVTT
jgi:release factor glutamine methyltransferase